MLLPVLRCVAPAALFAVISLSVVSCASPARPSSPLSASLEASPAAAALIRDATYSTVKDLSAAFQAAGGSCAEFTSVGSSGACDNTAIDVFEDASEQQDVLDILRGGTQEGEILEGPNWIIAGEGAAKLASSLGGDVFIPGGQSTSTDDAKSEDDDDSEEEDTKADETYFVVTGSGRAASVTYLVDGSIEQVTNATLPWRLKAEAGTIYSLTAQNGGGGSITCEFQDGHGQVRGKHTSHGAYAVVSCSE